MPIMLDNDSLSHQKNCTSARWAKFGLASHLYKNNLGVLDDPCYKGILLEFWTTRSIHSSCQKSQPMWPRLYYVHPFSCQWLIRAMWPRVRKSKNWTKIIRFPLSEIWNWETGSTASWFVCYSKWDLWTSSIYVSWEIIKNVHPLP